jgi:uncharacterized protein
MAQPSIAREPSMEEILASIRQIIESNEPGSAKPISQQVMPSYADPEVEEEDTDIHLTVDEAYAHVEFPEANISADPRFVAANSAGTREAEQAERSLSLADVAARVRAASERATPPLFGDAPSAQGADYSVEPTAAPPQTNTPSLSIEAETASFIPAAQLQPAPEPAQPQGFSALMSEDAGLQIARSFEELAIAIDGAQRRSLDEIAENMLRPMLREWLDDNLPTLVERLVREEIERVARGPRR